MAPNYSLDLVQYKRNDLMVVVLLFMIAPPGQPQGSAGDSPIFKYTRMIQDVSLDLTGIIFGITPIVTGSAELRLHGPPVSRNGHHRPADAVLVHICAVNTFALGGGAGTAGNT